MYESTNSNGYIAEIAIKKYDASSADVDCGAAATLTPNVLGAYNVDQWSAFQDYVENSLKAVLPGV